MKVLLINNCHWRRGGSESVYFGTAELLVNAGHEVVFLSFEDNQNLHTKCHEYFIKRGNLLKNLIHYFANGEAARVIEDVIKKEKPDIAHSHLMWGGVTASIIPVLHKYSIPLVHTAHDYRLVCPAYLFKDGKGNQCERCKGGRYYQCCLHNCSKGSRIESFLMTLEMYYRNFKFKPLSLVDGFVFVSNFSKNKHVEFEYDFNKVKTLVLYNCPNDKVEESYDEGIDSFNSYYLFYGRLSAEKGTPTLIKAFEKIPQLKLKIVGTGPLEDELKGYVQEHQIRNIEFVGYKTGKELFDIVAHAKYVCVSSECYENNPMTIVEAYSLRTPVVGAAIGGITEVVVDGETGYKFESGNVFSLIDALNKANGINKEEYNLQKNNAFKFSQQKFSRENYLEKLLGFYNEMKNTMNIK